MNVGLNGVNKWDFFIYNYIGRPPKLYCCYHFVGDSDTFQHIRIEFSVASTGVIVDIPKGLL